MLGDSKMYNYRLKNELFHSVANDSSQWKDSHQSLVWCSFPMDNKWIKLFWNIDGGVL